MYKWEYKTPEGYDDLIMNSDGTYLTCLCFKNSSDIKKLKENGILIRHGSPKNGYWEIVDKDLQE